MSLEPPEAPFLRAHKILLDTCILVAAINKHDQNHWFAARYLPHLRGSVFTCEPCMFEAIQLVRNSKKGCQKGGLRNANSEFLIEKLFDQNFRVLADETIWKYVPCFLRKYPYASPQDAYISIFSLRDPKIIVMTVDKHFQTYGVSHFGPNGYESMRVDWLKEIRSGASRRLPFPPIDT